MVYMKKEMHNLTCVLFITVPEEGTTGTPEDAGTTTPQQGDLTSSTTPNPVPVSTTTVNNTDTTTTGSQCAEQTVSHSISS